VHEGTKEGVQPINVLPLHVKSIFFFQCIRPFGKGIPITKLAKTATMGLIGSSSNQILEY